MTKKSILLIDDDAVLGEELAELLGAEGYLPENVQDSDRALELIRKKTYDVYLLDFKMRGMTGIDLLRVIRKKAPRAPVFFVSGRPGLAALLETENLAGAVREIIEKPFEARFLLDRVKASLV